MLKIIIAGGSGQVGSILARAFQQQGHDVSVLSRNASDKALPVKPERPWRIVTWDGATLNGWSDTLDGSDVVINLAGRSVNCRYTSANRQSILDSRVMSTRAIAQAIALAHRPPRVWLQASTATIYSHRYDAPNDETSGIIGGNEPDAPRAWRFSIDVARAWEREFDLATTPRTRKIALRSAMTMSPDPGGIFDTLLRLVRFGLGGRAGDGRQFISWVHHEDFANAVQWLIDREDVTGVVNIATPNPLPNDDFMRDLRNAWGTHIGLPASRWMLNVGAVFIRTETELILKSRRVIPKRLLDLGFRFKHPVWSEAAADLCSQWKQERRS
jgi:uncharacterized protein (TIGR01777 family)